MATKLPPVEIPITADPSGIGPAINQVNRQLGTIATAASKVDRSFKSAFGLLGGGFVIGTSLRAIAQNTIEAERAAVLLGNALETAGVVSKSAASDLLAYSTQLQRSTTFSDEAITGVQTLLLGFRGLSGGVVKQATSNILDLSTRLGIDLPTAAKMVGRALEDPVKGMTALTRAGVLFSEAQKDQIKGFVESGELARAQGVILAELEDRFEGAAAAARNTFGGALAGLKNAAGDLLEVGAGSASAVAGINDLSAALEDPATKEALSVLTSAATSFFAAVVEGAASAVIATNDFVKAFTSAQALTAQNLSRSAVAQYGTDAQKAGLENQLYREAGFGGPTSRGGARNATAEFTTQVAAVDGAAAGLTDRQLQAMENIARIKLDNVRQILSQAEESLKNFRDPAILALQENFELQTQLEEQLTESIREQNEARLAIAIDSVDREFVMRQSAQSAIDQLQAATYRNALAGLQAYAGQYKKVAIALVAIQKGRALAEAFMLGKVAVAQAAASAPPPYNLIPIAKAVAFAAANIASIAAAGYGQIASINANGGAALGSPSNPVFTDNYGESDGNASGATDRGSIQITIQGYIGRQQITEMVDALREEIGERDVVLIGANSRQAMELAVSG